MRCLMLALIAVFASMQMRASEPAFEEFTDSQRKSIDMAVKWLLKAQNRDGSWGLEQNSPGDITCTALAGMALLEAGATEREGPDGPLIKAVRGAAEYIVKAAKSSRGDIERNETTLIQGKLGRRVHNFFAVTFLTQLYGMRTSEVGTSTNEEMKEIIEKLTDIIAKSQESDGSWHKETWGSLKATGMAWLALRSAASTGVPIKHAAVDKTVRFIKSKYNAGTHLYDTGASNGQYQVLYATATSVRVMVGQGEGKSAQTLACIDAFIHNCRDGEWKSMYLTVEGEDYLSALLMTHSLISGDEDRWKKWFTYIRSTLCQRQNGDGSWVTTACITGRTFATACSLLTLSAPNRYTPIQQ